MREYRRLREPVILAPQFHPLFVRLEFLRRVTPTTPVKEIDRDVAELVQFVRTLNMGQFYGDKMEALLRRARCIYIPKSWRATDSECETALAAEERKYREKVAACHAEVWDLIMELCSFQGWSQDKHSSV